MRSLARRTSSVAAVTGVAVVAVLSVVACGTGRDGSSDASNSPSGSAASANSRDSAQQKSAAAAPSGNYQRIAVGGEAPLYAAATLRGDSIHLGANGEPVTVMNVWATWCTSCREEMQDLETLQRDYRSKGVRVLGISVDEVDRARVQKFVDREKLTFDIVHDQDGRVQGLYQVAGIPNTFIIGKNGRILWRSIGNLHGVVDSLRRVLDTVAQ